MSVYFNKIIFFYPSKITGGAEYLFLRCAEYLAENQTRYKIFVSDYNDGFLCRNINSRKINFLEYRKGHLTSIPDGAIVIVQLNLIIDVKEKISFNEQKSRVLYWCLHTMNLRPYYHVNGIYMLSMRERKKFGQVIRALTSMNVIKFMALSTYCKVGSDLNLKAEEFSWLPNLAPIDESARPSIKAPEGTIRLCWLGRLDEEKSRNVLTYMNELDFLSKNTKLSLSIIGIGEAEPILREKARKMHYEIKFVGELRDDNLNKFIRENVDVGLASGTSAWEFSLRGKPVIVESVIDKEYPAGVRNSYILTYEANNYYVSEQGTFIRTCTSTFGDKFKQILVNYEKESRNCYDYVISKGPSNCCNKILNAAHDIESVNTNEMLPLLTEASKLLKRASKRTEILLKIKRLFVWS